MAYTEEESCFDCGSLNLSYKYVNEDEYGKLYEVICHDCGNYWNDVLED